MRGYLGLGSNEGDRRAHLRAALAALADGELDVIASSGVYLTAPQGEVTEQRDFYNACLEVETGLGPEALLEHCKGVERALGRHPGGPRHGPRPIDVDVLLLGSLQHRSKGLTLPHPEIAGRRFVLVPLLELAPELELPDGTPLAPVLDSLAGQRVVRNGAF